MYNITQSGITSDFEKVIASSFSNDNIFGVLIEMLINSFAWDSFHQSLLLSNFQIFDNQDAYLREDLDLIRDLLAGHLLQHLEQ